MKPVKEAHNALRKKFTTFIAAARLNNAHARGYINEGRTYRHRARKMEPDATALMERGWACHAKGMALRMTGDRALTLALAFLNNTLYEDAERQRRFNLNTWHYAPILRLLQPCYPSLPPMKLSAWIRTWTANPLRPRDCAPPDETIVTQEAAAP